MHTKLILTGKKFFIVCLSIIVFLLIIICGLNIIVDPYFHYHAPLDNYGYRFYHDRERYINDGILKHYEYNALIIGNSMVQNFKTSEFDEIFGVNSIKTAFPGASFKEVDQNVRTALKYNKNCKTIIRCIDDNKLLDNKDSMSYPTYPTYLYDNNIFNDFKYLLNKDILKNSINILNDLLSKKNPTTSFDDYGYWNDYFTFGVDAILKEYDRPLKSDIEYNLTEKDVLTITETINQNVIETAKNYPDVNFYLFITPYSIIYWDTLNQRGLLNKQIQAQKLAIEIMLECPNIKLFSFFEKTDIICNLNNYKDPGHYSAEINSLMLQYMKNNTYLLTKNNYQDYINNISTFFNNYNYDSIFE